MKPGAWLVAALALAGGGVLLGALAGVVLLAATVAIQQFRRRVFRSL